MAGRFTGAGDAAEANNGKKDKKKPGQRPGFEMELVIRFELTTSSLPMTCSTY